MTGTAQTFTETRTTSGFYAETAYLGYAGIGASRSLLSFERSLKGTASTSVHNSGSPYSLHLRARHTDGVLTGRIKVTKMRHAVGDFYSLRTIGNGNPKRTVYLRGDALVIVEGNTLKMRDFFDLNS